MKNTLHTSNYNHYGWNQLSKHYKKKRKLLKIMLKMQEKILMTLKKNYQMRVKKQLMKNGDLELAQMRQLLPMKIEY
jgi:hypothetical protein